MVELRQLDFAITHLPVVNASLHVQPLTPLRLVLVGLEDDERLSGQQEISLGDLANVPLILLRRSSGPGLYERIVGAFTEAGVQP